MFKIGSIFLDVSEICKKTAYQILINICLTETCTITSKYKMTFDKLFIMKQSIIIYKIQARFICPKSVCMCS